jgi:hypothetical protein
MDRVALAASLILRNFGDFEEWMANQDESYKYTWTFCCDEEHLKWSRKVFQK